MKKERILIAFDKNDKKIVYSNCKMFQKHAKVTKYIPHLTKTADRYGKKTINIKGLKVHLDSGYGEVTCGHLSKENGRYTVIMEVKLEKN